MKGLVFLLVLIATHAMGLPQSFGKRDVNAQSASFTGAGTYYEVGSGSCGETDTDDEMVVAVNTPQMHNGPNPNTNPECDKFVYIQGDKGQCKARIVDTCPTCVTGALDMSPAVFKSVCGDLSRGNCRIRWKFL